MSILSFLYEGLNGLTVKHNNLLLIVDLKLSNVTDTVEPLERPTDMYTLNSGPIQMKYM